MIWDEVANAEKTKKKEGERQNSHHTAMCKSRANQGLLQDMVKPRIKCLSLGIENKNLYKSQQ